MDVVVCLIFPLKTMHLVILGLGRFISVVAEVADEVNQCSEGSMHRGL